MTTKNREITEADSPVKELRRLRHNTALVIWTETGCNTTTAYDLAGRLITQTAKRLGFRTAADAEAAMRQEETLVTSAAIRIV